MTLCDCWERRKIQNEQITSQMEIFYLSGFQSWQWVSLLPVFLRVHRDEYLQLFSGVSGEERIHVTNVLLWTDHYFLWFFGHFWFCFHISASGFISCAGCSIKIVLLNFLYCRGSCDSFPPVADFCRGESIRTADLYSAKVDIDYHAESDPVDLVNTL